MGDRVAVMRRGKLVQVDRPQALYDHPVDLFVGGFIGSPAMNLLRARLRSLDGSIVAEIGSASLSLPERALPRSLVHSADRDVIIGIRPEHVEDAALAATNGKPTLEAPVTLAEPMGAQVVVHLEVDCPPVVTRDTVELARDAGVEGGALADPVGSSFTACLTARTSATRGRALRLAVDPSSLYFFDPETEAALT